MRERITISIKKDLLSKIDQQIDGFEIRNRSHAIEHFVSQSLGISGVGNVVILGGGKGALKLIPIIEKVIEDLKSSGFNNIYLAVGYLGAKIKEYIGDGQRFKVKIHYLEGGEGTGGALQPLKNKFDKTFLVINLDEYFNLDINKFMKFHRARLGTASVASGNTETLKGYYLFEPAIFANIPKGFSMLENDIFPKLIENNQLVNYPL